MLQTPWPAWFFSNVAAVLCLLIWGARALPSDSPLPVSACFGALVGTALLVGTQLGMSWARRARMQVTLVPMCLVLATLGVATAMFYGTPGVEDTRVAWVLLEPCCVVVASGQAGMFAALVHPPAQDETPPLADLGTALAVQALAGVGAGGLYLAAAEVGLSSSGLLGAAALLWVAAAGLYLWLQQTTARLPGVHAASVSMASLLRHRRWPLLGVAALCGGLAACTPTLWVQSLQCVPGLWGVEHWVPLLMLAGYGIGAKVSAAASERPATVRLALAITLLGCAGFFLIGMIYFNTLPRRLQLLELVSDEQSWRRITLEILLIAMVVLPGSIGTGACLPLVAGAVGNGAPAGAHTLSRVLHAYGAGMLGGAALIPMLAQYAGLEATMRAAALLYTFAALVSSSAATVQRKVVRGLDAAALVVALAIAAWPRWTVSDVEWSNFRKTQLGRGEDGLQYPPTLDNMRPHARRSALPEDQGSS